MQIYAFGNVGLAVPGGNIYNSITPLLCRRPWAWAAEGARVPAVLGQRAGL